MKKLQLFSSLFLLNLLDTTFIHLQLSRPFLPMDWIYTANEPCSVGCTIAIMIPILTLEFILNKIGIKSLYRAGVLAILYLYSYYFVTHLEEHYCEITQTYDAYVVLYWVDFLVTYGLFYWFMKERDENFFYDCWDIIF